MNPYENLSEEFFWSTAVAKRNMFDIEGLWNPKFRITTDDKVATFGSCFAQHIGHALSEKGFNWLITEPAPRGLNAENAHKYNYGVFSARTGNIYTVSLLQQWVSWATGEANIPEEIWEKDGRYYDPFRPKIEPNGFLSMNELRLSRERAIEAFRECLMTANVFVFTLGLTESWFNREHGYEYPMCPGTVGGVFNSDKHQFVNQDFPFIRQRLETTLSKIRGLNPGIKILLTVSPVPLTATKSGNHVLVATMESKSVLRAVAGQMTRKFGFIDYFPSYEIVNATPFRGAFFEPNQRSVNHVGVSHVMDSFFKCLQAKFPMLRMQKEQPQYKEDRLANIPSDSNSNADAMRDSAVVCEEELLNAFANKLS